ncbi:MAG: Uma2 family endonuclease [Candidatus Hydrogenedentes bacterium]|nr:Uma2 family endonuclease [Candidatus Hydrogenedentota bacterium]
MSVSRNIDRLLQAQDLNAPGMPEKHIELVEGELIEMTPAGKWHNRIGFNLQSIFREFCLRHAELDFGGGEDGFLVHRNPDTVLCPDACLFRTREEGDSTWMPFTTELVCEVLSPSNSATEMALKRQRYFDGGCEQFWLVYPDERRIAIYHRDGRIFSLSGDDAGHGEGIAEGMVIDLGEVFRDR